MAADGILFIHAFPLDSTMWEPQIAAFSKHTKVAAVDLPGFGKAGPSGRVMNMEEGANAAARAARAAGIERAVVVGLSMGGYIALALWRQHRDLVAGLVLANTKAEADDEAAVERRKGLAARLRAEGSDFMVESPPPLLSEDAPDELWRRVKDIIARQPADSIGAASLGMAERPDSTPDLAGIDVPVAVVTGSKDTLIPPAATKAMADHIPGVRYEEIEGAGHLSNLEAPERFNEIVADVLRQAE